MIHRIAAVTLCAATLSGCAYFGASFAVDQLNKTQATGSKFTQALADQYRTRANDSQNVRYHYTEAYRNADRGLYAAAGNAPAPYEPQVFMIPSELLPELQEARTKLTAALAGGAPQVVPQEAAAAQAKFDCWAEDAAKTWKPELYKICRAEFYSALQQVQAMQGEPVDLSATSLNDQAVDANANRFMLFFGNGKTNLNIETAASLDEIAKIIQTRKPKQVRVEGHSDAAGSRKSKQRVSDARTQSVVDALIVRGVPKEILMGSGMADKKPLYDSKNKSVAANRRAEILLEF